MHVLVTFIYDFYMLFKIQIYVHVDIQKSHKKDMFVDMRYMYINWSCTNSRYNALSFSGKLGVD